MESIECVILSHNDRDHATGFEELAKTFGEKIQNIYLLQDRPIEAGDVLDVAMSLYDEQVIPKPQRAEVRDLAEPLRVWKDSASQMCLKLLYPDMIANIRAQRRKDPNLTSAIAAFYCHEACVLFPGDSSLAAWRRLDEGIENLPMAVAVMAMPHHGGLLKRDVRKQEMQWLFSKAIRPNVVTISVGTRNSHGHPRPMIVDVLRESDVAVMCTEVTEQCANGEDLARLGLGVIPPDRYSLTSMAARFGGSEYGEHVACAGTIVGTLSEAGVDVDRKEEHRVAKRSKVKRPRCLADGTPLYQ